MRRCLRQHGQRDPDHPRQRYHRAGAQRCADRGHGLLRRGAGSGDGVGDRRLRRQRDRGLQREPHRRQLPEQLHADPHLDRDGWLRHISSATQTLTIHDSTAPSLSGQGADATIESPATPVFSAPTASDNWRHEPAAQLQRYDQPALRQHLQGDPHLDRHWMPAAMSRRR